VALVGEQASENPEGVVVQGGEQANVSEAGRNCFVLRGRISSRSRVHSVLFRTRL